MPSLTKVQTGFIEPQGAFEMDPGHSGAPGIYFTGDTSTGIFSPSVGELGFSTGSAQQALTIHSSGNVGIGTTSADSSAQTHILRTGGNVGLLLESDQSTAYSYFKASGTTGSYKVAVGAEGDNLLLVSGGAKKVTLDSTGNVGIGTDNPTQKLHVKSDTVEYLYVENTTSTNVGLRFKNSAKDWYLLNDSNGDVQFYNGTAGEVKLKLTSTGNVGIGTTSPETKLDVNGDVKVASGTDSKIYCIGSASYANHLSVGSYNTAGSSYFISQIAFGSDGYYGNNGVIKFYTAPGSSSITERMRITSSGNVGIGTDNPDGKLDVRGSLFVGERGAGDTHIEVGSGRTANGFAYIDLIGDTTYTDYGLRVIRANSGANSSSGLIHRGTGELYLQSSDAGSIGFYTSNAPRVTINSSGNVGIGTTNPGYKLELSSASGATTLKIGNRITNSDYGIAYGYFDESSGVHGFSIDRKHAGTLTEKSFILRADSGYVGINTDTPIAHLQVAGTDSTIRATSTSSSSWRSRIIASNDTLDKAAFLGIHSTTPAPGVFAHNNALGAWAPLFINTTNGIDGSDVYIAGGGKVSIGNVSTGYGKLHVEIDSTGGPGAGSAAAIWLRNRNTTNGNSATIFSGDDVNNAASAINFVQDNHSAKYGSLQFHTRDGSGYSNKMYISAAGSVVAPIKSFISNRGASYSTAYTVDSTWNSGWQWAFPAATFGSSKTYLCQLSWTYNGYAPQAPWEYKANFLWTPIGSNSSSQGAQSYIPLSSTHVSGTYYISVRSRPWYPHVASGIEVNFSWSPPSGSVLYVYAAEIASY